MRRGILKQENSGVSMFGRINARRKEGGGGKATMTTRPTQYRRNKPHKKKLEKKVVRIVIEWKKRKTTNAAEEIKNSRVDVILNTPSSRKRNYVARRKLKVCSDEGGKINNCKGDISSREGSSYWVSYSNYGERFVGAHSWLQEGRQDGITTAALKGRREQPPKIVYRR